MMTKIEATFSCDECGREFFVLLDPAYEPPLKWSIFDMAVDALRGGALGTYRDDQKLSNLAGSVYDTCTHLCSRCTTRKDSEP